MEKKVHSLFPYLTSFPPLIRSAAATSSSSPPPLPHRPIGHRLCLKLTILILTIFQNPINESVFHSLLGGKKVIPIQILHNLLHGPSGHHGVQFANIVPNSHNLRRLHFDIFRLSLGTSHGLMDHDAGRWQGETLALGSGGKDEGCHAGGKSQIDGDDFRFDVLHGIVNGQSGNDGAAGTIDVEINGFGGVFGIEVEHDPNDLIGKFVINFGTQKDDALAVQAIVNVDPNV
jgi:hypothetical protein